MKMLSIRVLFPNLAMFVCQSVICLANGQFYTIQIDAFQLLVIENSMTLNFLIRLVFNGIYYFKRRNTNVLKFIYSLSFCYNVTEKTKIVITKKKNYRDESRC